MKKGQIIRVSDKGFAEHLTTMEKLFGSGNTPELQGELLAINPTAEEFATFDDNFRTAVAIGATSTEELVGTAVYYDKGAQRAFAIGVHMIEPADAVVTDEFEIDEEEESVEVQTGNIVKATGLGELFVSLAGGSGEGKVIHVGGQPIVDARVQEKVDSGDLEDTYIQEGVLYDDTGNGEIMWLAGDDYEVVGE